MKLLILILSLTNLCIAQKQVDYISFDSTQQYSKINYLQGSWKIDKLITQKPAKEYILSKRDESKGNQYGNNITFKPDGTFFSDYSAPCGNDCFGSSTGKYKIINESYICILLEHEWRHGNCDFSDLDSTNKISAYDKKLRLDLGVFRVYKDSGRIQLFNSDGNPKEDKKKLEYIEMLTQKSEEISNCFPSSHRYLNWHEMIDSNSQTKVTDVVNFITNKLAIDDYQVLSDRDFGNEHLILLKIKNEFRYILFKNSSIRNKAFEVALYENSFFENLENFASKIDKNRTLKKKVIKEREYNSHNSQLKNTISLFSKNGEPQKLIYDIYNGLGYFKMIFYIDDGKPTIVKIENEKSGNFTYYVYSELSQGAVMKPIVEGWTFSGVNQVYYRIIELIKE